jgi:hypothetical protein
MEEGAVVRPKTAWDDPTDVLNAPVASFDITNTHVSDVLDVVLQAATPFLGLVVRIDSTWSHPFEVVKTICPPAMTDLQRHHPLTKAVT